MPDEWVPQMKSCGLGDCGGRILAVIGILLVTVCPAWASDVKMFVVQDGAVILGPISEGVQFRGPAALENFANDFDPTYRSRRRVQGGSIPKRLRALLRADVVVFDLGGKRCRSSLGHVFAVAWYAGEGPARWEHMDRATVGAEVFHRGRRFLAAALEDPDCRSGLWAVQGRRGAAIAVSSARGAGGKILSQTEQAMRQMDEYSRIQGEYERSAGFRAARSAKGWLDLPGMTEVWSVEDSAGKSIVVAHAVRQAGGFLGRLCGVWRVGGEAEGGRLQNLGVDGGGDNVPGVELQAAVSVDEAAPYLLFATEYGFGWFQAPAGRYSAVDTVTITAF